MMNLTMRGRCWKFGDNVGIDGDMMPLEFALKRETNPAVLGPYLMTGIDPDFPKRSSPATSLSAADASLKATHIFRGLLASARTA